MGSLGGHTGLLGQDKGKNGFLCDQWKFGGVQGERLKRNLGLFQDIRRKFGCGLAKDHGSSGFIGEGQREALGLCGEGHGKCWGSQ